MRRRGKDSDLKMPHSLVRAVTLVTLAHVSRHVAAAQFTCPEESGVFADPEQCDKYWVCYGGENCDISFHLDINPLTVFRKSLQEAVS